MAYVFDPEILREVASAHIGVPRDEMFDAITESLATRYPDYISREPEWFFNNAGGAMGTLTFLYASLSEYLILFGSPIGNQGHTGRYNFVEDWFWVLEGELWYFTEGQTEREVYRAGDVIRLRKGQVKAYRIVDNGWALEYARGWIPTMLPFGLADTVFSTLDYRTAFKTFRIYGKHILRNFGRRNPLPEVARKRKIP